MTRGVDNFGDGDCHCKPIMGTMYLRITWKIQSVLPIGFPVLVFVFAFAFVFVFGFSTQTQGSEQSGQLSAINFSKLDQ